MKFKLGLEFQESSNLYPWDIDNNVQKKPLFFFKKEEDYLWHVVIDTNGIEFVTRAFSPHEEENLTLCITSILAAVDSLKDIFLKVPTTTFDQWKNRISLYYQDQEEILLEKNENINFSNLQEIKRPYEKWEPRFSPQVTIQHSLSITIPLYFSLFGFDSADMVKFSASFPNREIFLDIYKKIEICQTAYNACEQCYNVFKTQESKTAFESSKSNCENLIPRLYTKLWTMYQELCSPLDGLVFLHALTLVNMTPNEDIGDKKFLAEILVNQQKYQQIDPKLCLNLMSRRPFSSMYSEFQEPNFSYYKYFKKTIEENNRRFRETFEVPTLFNKTNYGEQFFEQNRQLVNLENFSTYFQDSFFFANKGIISRLLNQGIIGTAMLRNFKEEYNTNTGIPIFTLFKDYYEQSIITVEIPRRRYSVDSTNCAIVQEEQDGHDALSPPWILDSSNSMGRFKEIEMAEQDLRYGQAIIEVRSIRNVQPWFLRNSGLNSEIAGIFLVKPNRDLVNQVLGLFNFLGVFEQRLFNDRGFNQELVTHTLTSVKKY